MDRACLNMINRQTPIDPAESLKKLRIVEHSAQFSAFDPMTRRLRTHGLKRDRELREACLFCHGMSIAMGRKVWVYPLEDADFDFVAGWEVEKELHLVPTQLKEVVPDYANPKASLQTVIDRLVTYQASKQLAVAIHFNQEGQFQPDKLVLPNLKIASLWIFGAVTADQSRWFICGDMTANPACMLFDYPS
jgi:hypothetical protein